MVRWWRSFDFEGLREGSSEGREGMLEYVAQIQFVDASWSIYSYALARPVVY